METIARTVCCLVVISLTLTTTGGAVADGVKHAPLCNGAECVHTATKQDPPSHPARAKRQSVIVVQDPPSHPARAKRQSVIVVQDPPSHRVACTITEERKTACLNGRCYALDMGEMRTPFCHCPEMYEGTRCEQLSAYFFLAYSASLKKAAIIGSVIFAVIIIIVCISVYCSYRKGKKKRKNASKTSEADWGIEAKHESNAMLPNGESQV